MPNVTSTKEARYELRLSAEEKQLYQEAAEKDDRSLASWIRHTLNTAAKLQTGKE